MITVRDASTSDIESIVDFNARLAAETEDKQLDSSTLRRGVERALNDPAKARYWIADSNGEAAGQLMVTLEWSDWRDGFFWWVQSVYVAEPFRRQGIFTSLYKHVAELSRTEPDVCGIRLYVERENHRAQAAYRRLGMEDTPYEMFEICW